MYNDLPFRWLLLEVLEQKDGRAEWFYLIKQAASKDELYDFLMDETEDWEMSNHYIFVYADPNEICKI